jgi:aminoglycoside phosphotransferase (APT) family kinase protein
MDLGEPIAVGRTAEIYTWEEDQVLKLFRDWTKPSWVAYEARVAKSVHASGLSVPAVGEIIEIGGRHGLVYERVDGPTMLELLMKKPGKLNEFARLLAELQAGMHVQSVPNLPSQRERLMGKINNAGPLSPELKIAVLKALDALPDGDRICHGDFHPDNVLMASRGPVVIDWTDVTSGHPYGDVARTVLLIRGATATKDNPVELPEDRLRKMFFDVYIERYLEIVPGNIDELWAWIPVIAAARLDENISEEEEMLMAIVKSGLGVD